VAGCGLAGVAVAGGQGLASWRGLALLSVV